MFYLHKIPDHVDNFYQKDPLKGQGDEKNEDGRNNYFVIFLYSNTVLQVDTKFLRQTQSLREQNLAKHHNRTEKFFLPLLIFFHHYVPLRAP